METWLTYSAALLMAWATAFTFSSSSSLLGMLDLISYRSRRIFVPWNIDSYTCSRNS